MYDSGNSDLFGLPHAPTKSLHRTTDTASKTAGHGYNLRSRNKPVAHKTPVAICSSGSSGSESDSSGSGNKPAVVICWAIHKSNGAYCTQPSKPEYTTKKGYHFCSRHKSGKFGIQPERIGSNKLTIKQIKNTEDTVKYRSDATIPQKSTVERSNAFRLPTNTSAISTTTNTTATQSIKHQPELLLAHHRQNKIHQHTICKTKSKHVN